MSVSLEYEIFRYDSCESTNLKARSLFQNASSLGVCVVARRQTQGRGSHGRKWISPAGGFYISVVLKKKPNRALTDLSLLAGIALNQTVTNMMPKQNEATLKWPNDCLIGGKKVAGILSESLGDDEHAVVGVGINVNTPSEDLKNIEARHFAPTSMKAITGNTGEYSLDQVEKVFLSKLKGLYELYWTENFDRITFLWESNCLDIGRELEFLVQEKPTAQKIKGRLEGIDEQGAVVISHPDGAKKAYVSGEIVCYLSSTSEIAKPV